MKSIKNPNNNPHKIQFSPIPLTGAIVFPLLTHNILRSAFPVGPVQRRVEVDRKRVDLPPLLRILLRRQHVEQVRETLQLLHVGLLAQLIGRLVRLGTHLQTTAALGVQIAEALGTLLTARTVLHVTLTALG